LCTTLSVFQQAHLIDRKQRRDRQKQARHLQKERLDRGEEERHRHQQPLAANLAQDEL